MLSPEERKRIEDEERKRIAEEQYRAEFRSKLQRPDATEEKRSRLLWVLGVGCMLIVGALIWSYSSSRTRTIHDGVTASPAAQHYVPMNQKIATGPIIVKAHGYVQYLITITSDMVEPMISGNFNASGGSGNDIEAAIADETNYTNWINGHQAQVFWSTGGRETTGNFRVKLQPGTYHLAFSNRFSALTDKQVFVDADLNYKKAEPAN